MTELQLCACVCMLHNEDQDRHFTGKVRTFFESEDIFQNKVEDFILYCFSLGFKGS